MLSAALGRDGADKAGAGGAAAGFIASPVESLAEVGALNGNHQHRTSRSARTAGSPGCPQSR